MNEGDVHACATSMSKAAIYDALYGSRTAEDLRNWPQNYSLDAAIPIIYERKDAEMEKKMKMEMKMKIDIHRHASKKRADPEKQSKVIRGGKQANID